MIANYRRLWQRFIKYADERNVKHFDIKFGFRFALERYGLGTEKLAPPHTNFERFVFRALRCLSEHQLHGMAYRRVRSDVYIWPHQLEKAFKGYLFWLKPRVKKKTFERQDYILRRFAELIAQNGCYNLNDLTVRDFHCYIESLQRYTTGTVNDYIAKAKAFLKFAYNQNFTIRDLTLLIPKTAYVPAAKLGMCSSDICNLQFQNIRWDANTIEVTQIKTGQLLVLPLLKEIGEAIVDYLKNGRPERGEKNIFIKHCAPYDKFTTHSAMY